MQLVSLCGESAQSVTLCTAVHAQRSGLRSMEVVTPYAARLRSPQLVMLYAAGYAQRIWLRSESVQLVMLRTAGHALRG